MIKEIGCFKFPGFYESIFCNSDEFIDYEFELKEEVENLIDSKEFEVALEYDNFDKYKTDVCNAFMRFYVDKLIEVLPYDITEHEDFKFKIIDDSIEVISPQYYNYSTDRCFCQIETNRKTLKLIKEYTLRLEGVEQYIKDHFTSCDGFISFITNDFNEWKELDIEDYEENQLIALLDMLIELSDKEAFWNITEDTHYDIDKYSYTYAVVYCKKNMPEKDRKKLEEHCIRTEDWWSSNLSLTKNEPFCFWCFSLLVSEKFF